MPRVIVIKGADEGKQFELSEPILGVGRDSSNRIRLHDTEVSRRHAIVSLGEGQITIEDLGSFNGTHTDAGELKGETELRVGDRFRVGQSVLELREVAGADPEDMKPTKTSLPRARG